MKEDLDQGLFLLIRIVGMGEAFRIANDEMESDNLRIKKLRDKFWNQIKDVEENLS